MKRFLSAFFAVVLVFTMLPFGALAAEDGTSVQDELISQACNVFPEYAEKISRHFCSNQLQSQSLNDYSSKIVHSETRAISDDAVLTYTEYSSGIVTLASAKYNASFTTEGTDVSGSITYVTATLKGTVSNVGCSNVFIAEDFTFAIYANGYDRITSLGNYYVTNGGSIESAGIGRQIETATNPATAYFRTIIYYNSGAFNGLYTFSLRGNVPSVSYQNNT